MDTIVDRERNEIAEVLEEYSARANLCRLFAGAFAEEPSEAYVAALRTPQSREALAAMGARFDADFEVASDGELAEALACEWTTLFASPGGCPPIESVRMTGRMQQEPFHAVRETYRRAGFKVAPGRFSVVDDQLGVELLFVASLLERIRAAIECHDLLQQDRTLKELQRFWVLHLGRWVRGYASLVERATLHSFFRELARLLREFAEGEIEALHVRVDDIDGGRLEVPKSEIAIDVDPDEPECNACVARSAASPTMAPIVLHR